MDKRLRNIYWLPIPISLIIINFYFFFEFSVSKFKNASKPQLIITDRLLVKYSIGRGKYEPVCSL